VANYYEMILLKQLNVIVHCLYVTHVIIIIIIIIIIPVIIGAAGTISKSFRKYVRSIPGNHEVRRKQPYWALHTYFGKC
jgi:hypothetical protein